jgi:hypothetical protein
MALGNALGNGAGLCCDAGARRPVRSRLPTATRQGARVEAASEYNGTTSAAEQYDVFPDLAGAPAGLRRLFVVATILADLGAEDVARVMREVVAVEHERVTGVHLGESPPRRSPCQVVCRTGARIRSYVTRVRGRRVEPRRKRHPRSRRPRHGVVDLEDHAPGAVLSVNPLVVLADDGERIEDVGRVVA